MINATTAYRILGIITQALLLGVLTKERNDECVKFIGRIEAGDVDFSPEDWAELEAMYLAPLPVVEVPKKAPAK